MSAYIQLLTPMTDEVCLLAALTEVAASTVGAVATVRHWQRHTESVALRSWSAGQMANIVAHQTAIEQPVVCLRQERGLGSGRRSATG